MVRGIDHKKNYRSESDGISELMRVDTNIIFPQAAQKRRLLEICDLPNLYLRSFDLVKIHVEEFSQIKTLKDFTLIEVKVTRKDLPNFPKDFFFGLTQNEEKLLKDLEGSFLLCLISKTDREFKYEYFDYNSLNKAIRRKRIQFQINL